MSKSELELRLHILMLRTGIPVAVEEMHFDSKRRWRFDFAWPGKMVAAEVEGGTWVRGRHNRGKGFESDCHKYNQATLLGWRVFRFTPGMIDDGTAIATLKEALRESVA